MKTKAILTLIFIFIAINLSAQPTPFEYTIKGKVTGQQSGSLYLFGAGGRVGDEITIPYYDGTFEYKGTSPFLYTAIMAINSFDNIKEIVIEPGEIIFEIDIDSINNKLSIISGQHNLEFQNANNNYLNFVNPLLETLYSASTPDSIKQQINDTLNLYVRQLVIDNWDNYAGIYFFNRFVGIDQFSEKDKTDFICNQNNLFFRQSLEFRELTSKWRKEKDSINLLNHNAYNFKLPNEKGEIIQFNDIANGKVTFVEKSGSWCGNLTNTTRSYKTLYEKYNDYGFEIITFVNELKYDRWHKWVEEENYPWTTVIELESNDSIYEHMLFDRYMFPANYLVNEDGIIIAESLSAEALNEILMQKYEPESFTQYQKEKWNLPESTEPLILEGKIINSAISEFQLIIESESGERYLDTIRLSDDGSFHYITHNVTFPQKTDFRNKDVQLNGFYIAPGYHLTITGDGADFMTLLKTAKIEGAESNRYKRLSDSINVSRMDLTRWYELKDDSLLQFIKNDKHFTDSLENVVFNREDTNDPYLSYFGRMTHLNNQFLRIYYLIAGVNMKLIDEEKAYAFAVDITDKTILENLFDEKYMISDNYKDWFLTQYLTYLINKDFEIDPSLKERKYYRIEKIDSEYRGKAREYMLYKQLETTLAVGVSTNEQLDEFKPIFEKYLSEINNSYYKQKLTGTFYEQESWLLSTQKGEPAPDFTLISSKGETYSLSDFRGKVVYLDLWASWCEPCRQEIPALKEMFGKYKSDNRIAIIGIGVHDKYENWKKAIEEDSTEWLQLYDDDGLVAQLYQANAIPKYILIDSEGNIVDMNAPRPGNSETLIIKINELLNK